LRWTPLIALAGLLSGGALWLWYDDLNEEQKRSADEIMAASAKRLFGKLLDQLNAIEARQVHELTRRHFEG